MLKLCKGVDAVNTSLETVIFSAALNLGQGWRTLLILFACTYHPPPLPPITPAPLTSPALLTFYVQTWDEYHTKTLTLGIISGPVEGILTIIVVFLFTALKGPNFWHRSVLSCFGVSRDTWSSGLSAAFYDLAWTDWYMIYGGLVLFFCTYTSILNVLSARTLRAEPAASPLKGLLPFAFTWTLIPIYLLLHPTILRTHLIPFVFYAGLTNAYAVGQIIIGHLTQSSFPMHNILNTPLIVAIVDGLGTRIGLWSGWLQGEYEVSYLFACLGLAVGVYGSFVVEVIVSICDYLDIW